MTQEIKFCWHCARQFRGNLSYQYTASDGNTYLVHKDCKEILEGGFNHKLPIDEEPESCSGCGHMEDYCICDEDAY